MATKTGQGPKKEKLDLSTLGRLANGVSAAVINAAIRAALRDTEDRGSDKKARKVTIEIEMKKLNDESITAAVKAKTTLPPYLTEPTIAHLKIDGEKVDAEFNPHSAANPGQMTMSVDDDE